MATTQIWLQLTEADGGRAFGPLEAPEVRLGTADDVDVQVAQGLGVGPVHARLVRRSADTFYLSAVDRDREVWLCRAGEADPVPLHGPVVTRVGDGFALGGPRGVRFHLIRKDAPADHAASSKRDAAAVKAFGTGLVVEIGRRVKSSALATWWGGFVETSWRFVAQRQFLAPVYLVGLLTILTGWGFGAAQCRSATRHEARASSAEAEVTVLAERVRELESRTTSVVDLGELARRITGDGSIVGALGWDGLLAATHAELKVIFAQRQTARWEAWASGDDSPWAQATRALARQADTLPTPLPSVLAWAVVDPREAPMPGRQARWAASGGDCLRGPFRLAYAQALVLGLDPLPDVLVATRALPGLDGEQVRSRLVTALQGTVTAATGEEAPPIGDEVPVGIVFASPEGNCYAVGGEDRRDDPVAVAAALGRRLGVEAKGLPPVQAAGATLARIVLLHALALPPDVVARLDLRDGSSLGTSLAAAGDEGSARVIAATARQLAASLAIPCVLLLDRGEAALPASMPVPDFEACAILRARSDKGRW